MKKQDNWIDKNFGCIGIRIIKNLNPDETKSSILCKDNHTCFFYNPKKDTVLVLTPDKIEIDPLWVYNNLGYKDYPYKVGWFTINQHPQDSLLKNPCFKACIEGPNTIFQCEYSFRASNSKWVRLWSRGMPLDYHDGKAAKMLVIQCCLDGAEKPT